MSLTSVCWTDIQHAKFKSVTILLKCTKFIISLLHLMTPIMTFFVGISIYFTKLNKKQVNLTGVCGTDVRYVSQQAWTPHAAYSQNLKWNASIYYEKTKLYLRSLDINVVSSWVQDFVQFNCRQSRGVRICDLIRLKRKTATPRRIFRGGGGGEN